MKKPLKKITFNFFDYKWKKVPTWGVATEDMYRRWYLVRYGYRNLAGLKKFLNDKSLILEAGCGLARDSKMFAELNPNAHIVAADQSLQALHVARTTLKSFPNTEVMRADITDFAYPCKFDFISCDQALHHTPVPSEILRHLYDHLAPGGVLNFFVCRQKKQYPEFVDDKIMDRARTMSPSELWKFSEVVTRLGEELYKLKIKNINFQGNQYENLQRFVHNQVFRCWYNPSIPFELSLSSNYDWFSGNPRFNASEVR